MAAALGSCATLLANANTTFITMDEVTTVATAYALAPFASSLTSIGASGSNPIGLVNAFANAALLAKHHLGYLRWSEPRSRSDRAHHRAEHSR